MCNHGTNKLWAGYIPSIFVHVSELRTKQGQATPPFFAKGDLVRYELHAIQRDVPKGLVVYTCLELPPMISALGSFPRSIRGCIRRSGGRLIAPPMSVRNSSTRLPIQADSRPNH